MTHRLAPSAVIGKVGSEGAGAFGPVLTVPSSHPDAALIPVLAAVLTP